MSGDSFLLDTNTVVYLMKGDDTLALLLQDKNIFISFITEMELLSWPGLQEQTDIKKIQKVIEEFTVVELNHDIKNLAVAIRRKNKLKLPDAIILATSHYLNIPFITADKKLISDNTATVIYYKGK